MMALSIARCALAGLIAVLAGLVGVATPPRTAQLPAAPPSSITGGPGQVSASDISTLSARLRATGLFPAAIALDGSTLGGAGPESVEGGLGGEQDAIASNGVPLITALVRENRVWRLHAGGAITERVRLSEGDELFDGWRVDEISSTRVLLRRDQETRVVDVFEAPEGG